MLRWTRGSRKRSACPFARVRPRRLFRRIMLATAIGGGRRPGTVGFVGLVVPHRRCVWRSATISAFCCPACAFAGGALLVIADPLARTLIAPAAASGRRDQPLCWACRQFDVPAASPRRVRDDDRGRRLFSPSTALTLSVARRTLIDEVSLRVHAGDFWCILGANGAGKTLVPATRSPGLQLASTVAACPPTLRPARSPSGRLADSARVRGFLPQSTYLCLSDARPGCGRHGTASASVRRWGLGIRFRPRAGARSALRSRGSRNLETRDITTLSGRRAPARRRRAALLAQGRAAAIASMSRSRISICITRSLVSAAFGASSRKRAARSCCRSTISISLADSRRA